MTPTNEPSVPVLSLDSLTKRYGDVTALDDVSQRAGAHLLKLPAPGVPNPGHPFVLVARDLGRSPCRPLKRRRLRQEPGRRRGQRRTRQPCRRQKSPPRNAV